MSSEGKSPVREEVFADSPATQLLSDCWLAALGYRPAGWDDTLQSHRAGRGEQLRLAEHVRKAFRCHLESDIIRRDIAFGKTASLLAPLARQDGASDPVIYLAPGRSGVALGELLLCRDYPGPGCIHVLRYPSFEQMAGSRHIVQDLVAAIIDQLPLSSQRTSLLLAGYSLGAHVMLEAACRLANEGRRIDRIILINSVAFPKREHLAGIDRRLHECQTARDLAYSLLWKLSSQNRSVLQIWSRLLRLMKKNGLAEQANRIEVAVTGRVRVKACLDFQPARYLGEICLLRPLKATPESEEDGGWSALSTGVHISSFPVLASDFMKAKNRRYAMQELARLAAQQDLTST